MNGNPLALGLVAGIALAGVTRTGSRGLSKPTWFHGTTRYWWRKRVEGDSTLHLANSIEEAQGYAMEAAESEGAAVEGDTYSEIVVVGFTDEDLAPLERGVDWGWMSGFEVDLNAGTSPEEMKRLYRTDKRDLDALTWEDSVRGCGYLTVYGNVEGLKKRGHVVSRFNPSTQAWTSEPLATKKPAIRGRR